MDEVIVSRMQAVEFAKGIVEARDAELAFLLQIQEIMKSTANLQEHEVEAGEELEDPTQHYPNIEKLKASQVSGDVDKAAALNLSVDELGSFVEDTEETQLSLLEAARLAHLDAIREHDARFARSLANMSSSTRDSAEDPFTNSSVPLDQFLNEVDDYESVLSLLEDGSSLTGFARSRCSGAGMGEYNAAREIIPVMQRAKLSVTPLIGPLTIREIAPRKCPLDKQKQEKGKMVVQEEDGDCIQSSPVSFDSLNTRIGLPLIAGSSLENETDMNADEYGVQYCQICFEATQRTSSFVTLEGCEHQFCESCVSRHAEARILDGGQMHVTCLHDECPTIISYTQLSLLLSSTLLEVLTRRQIEAAIPEAERMYCPFRDCSALLFKPISHMDKPSSSAHPHPTASGCVECEACHRAFCLECAVPWHSDMSCAEFNANLKNLRLLGDEKLLQLAGQKKWQRCKKCGRLVELSHGCFHMTCLCRHEFCYTCGESWVGGAKSCSCPRWNESRL
ncbi:hypothetical protein KC19_10G136400 [Ceratodon purpureus]|uniref:RBR-type E3 ubiquitin transferase n=1 Tax=Ceratodon purpureus TaxID=3225 RepID=A0A8T0GLM8_CERPU|nr:hypothetical protein KC19_10G136400 [Ceratodon purpureus]